MSFKILILAGMAGAGKTEFADYCRSLNISVHNMGDAVRDRVRELGLELNGRNIARVASEERLKYGSDIWARRTARKTNGNCVIDGTRSEAEVSYFRRTYGRNAIIVAIYASAPLRYERLRKRPREDTPLSLGEFEERDRRELGWGLGNVIALSDRIIGNEGSLPEFRERIKHLLSDLSMV
jgi:dephospho-CoA kinase